MQTHTVTTPFGRRSMTLGMIASQVTAQTAPEGATVHKWHVFRDIKEARMALGATDRALAILDALLSFHPETAFYGDSALIVWPSNEQLIGRANGMSPATLRRHLANLVDCGLVVRRDSPNGKRYARKGQGGEIEQAYGFDLSPIVARAVEFKELAEAVRAEKKAYKVVKERLTICRRDIAKMIETGIEEGVPGNWGTVHVEYQAIISRLPRTAPRQVLEEVAAELDDLWTQIRDVLESFVKSQNLNANESQTERHIQNSNTESKTESERGLGIKREASGSAGETDNLRSLPKRELPLGIVLDACPNLLWLVKDGGGIRNWRDFLATTDLARPVLGISPSAWEDAKVAMGEQQAAITLAAIYQRTDQIKSPGGYLRNLTERAKEGKFSTWPMIMALLRAKLDAAKAVGAGVTEAEGELGAAQRLDRTQKRLEVSDNLRKSIDKWDHKA
ncbi:replication initiation protein RepC [Devosia limi DSM 17137]|uniref:Replication initiation protein RepC n=4 Tax=Devosia TaxID=46913 RepID=A0A0F5LUX0_9HYPH|nr:MULTISPECIES: plasmid replication protein RepC [Devosia]MBU1334401.1 replication initiation protein RepC [Alphaproteobacteria bacterium]KFL27560.1 replication initiation protein RepC [Devosia riboflavina]KKB86160.1 replication initiation protein RepC [Devosia limi DSM 17137]MBU1559745.1 replication initiation protein RepC [Alphaproteobacteria bacterium]MBU2305124.1 replication initiation protein RepC [Alphaproteobacteria bacterium]